MTSRQPINSKTENPQADDKILAYIAGLFDAELALHISVDGRNYHLKIDWLKINDDILTYVANIFGGTVREEKTHPKQRYQVWNWGLSSSNAYQTLFTLWPYFRIKQTPVTICIEFYNRYSKALTVSDKQSIGAQYHTKLQEYQRKPGNSKKSAEALKLIREKGSSPTAESELSSTMHHILTDVMLPEVETAYIAGLLDADSSFLIDKIHDRPSYPLEVKYRKYDRPTLEYLATIFGGRVRRAPISPKNQIQPWLWQVTSQKAYMLIKYIYPYLHIKKQNAEICMEFFEHYWTGAFGVSISPRRQRVGEEYSALLKRHLTKSMPHKKAEDKIP